jgi:hypothetical protein
MVDTRDYAIAEFPVRILRIPAAEAEQFTPAVLAALLFADGSGIRAAGAIRAARSLEDQRVIVLPPDQIRSLDRLLGEIDACTRCGRAVIAGAPTSCSMKSSAGSGAWDSGRGPRTSACARTWTPSPRP